MKIVCAGGGPAGLYFALLAKRRNPRHDVRVIERNGPDDTFGWGVVFSDETLATLAQADPASHQRMADEFAYWTDLDVFVGDAHVRSTGHGFCGLARRRLLNILHDRCRELGVNLEFGREIGNALELEPADLVLAADGVSSRLRDQHSAAFGPTLDWGRCRFCWLGADLPLAAFTFIFKQTPYGLFQVHAYPFDNQTSTFIVECREEVWGRAGLEQADEPRTLAFLEELFRKELRGRRLFANRSIWRRFPTVRNRTWAHGKLALIGDAAHTAHFSIGSGTKLAMEDAIALSEALGQHGEDAPAMLAAYQEARAVTVAKTQRVARTSLEWFENAARYLSQPPRQFVFNLLSRSKRISYDNLALRDPKLGAEITADFAGSSPHRDVRVLEPAYARGAQPAAKAATQTPPPLFQPFALRDLRLANRLVVSPMCQYSCVDGLANDWHLVHLGSRAAGGAGLVITEATHVAPEARISPGCAGLWNDEQAAAWKRVVDYVHTWTPARIGVQLAHAGRKGSCDLPWRGGQPLPTGGWELLAPSALPYAEGGPVPRTMTLEDLQRTKAQFVGAAERAARAGFDLLELHWAHGYLLGTFVSPLTNQRDDEYGGALDNRLRFPLEVFDAVRAVWPAERPISVRISATDWKPGGTDSADRLQLARRLMAHGCDLIDVSAGGTVPDQQPIYGRMFLAGFSDEIRNEAGAATMLVGNVQDADQANTVLAAGRTDLVAMARPHLRDPYLLLHAAERYGVTSQYWPPQYLAARP